MEIFPRQQVRAGWSGASAPTERFLWWDEASCAHPEYPDYIQPADPELRKKQLLEEKLRLLLSRAAQPEKGGCAPDPPPVLALLVQPARSCRVPCGEGKRWGCGAPRSGSATVTKRSGTWHGVGSTCPNRRLPADPTLEPSSTSCSIPSPQHSGRRVGELAASHARRQRTHPSSQPGGRNLCLCWVADAQTHPRPPYTTEPPSRACCSDQPIAQGSQHPLPSAPGPGVSGAPGAPWELSQEVARPKSECCGGPWQARPRAHGGAGRSGSSGSPGRCRRSARPGAG